MKKSLADRIEQYLKVLISRSDDKAIEIQRIELAETFDCVPSQVTYVISTRFTEKEGYITESRRGGCGYVRIRQSPPSFGEDDLEYIDLFAFLAELKQRQLLSNREAELIKYLVVNTCASLPGEDKRKINAAMVKALYNYFV
ncbi:MAG TPA: CtsR family transcriptional regulator [Syntrophomonas sp.]|nr:CtsR family transcriptional regulator [Syntrophomonas sp.]HRW11689.1 CtsR family transcriptional regulator [Syntrophomonas sp.]